MCATQDLYAPLSVRVPARRADAGYLLTELTNIARTVIEDRTVELSPDRPFDEVPGWDSMSHVSIIAEIECRFGLKFDLTEIELLDTVGDLLNLIQMKHAQASN
jgi:acyl carrier protein